jgi:hypothetical protein
VAVLGGALAEASWEWVFYINVPIPGVVLVIALPFLRITYKESSWSQTLRRVDWIGYMMFLASITSILAGLIFADVTAPWDSYRMILPLVLDFAGWITFYAFEASAWCPEPSVPGRLFADRTSLVGFILAFVGANLLQWTIYFLQIYFQVVKLTSPLTSGINTLP